MDIERLEEHELYVLRDVVSGLEEEQSIDHVIARQFEKVIDEALQAYQPKPDCESAEKLGDKCCGYGKSEYDDEPIDACKQCEKQASYEED